MNIKRLFLLQLFVVFASALFAQTNSIHYTVKDGLPHNTVFNVFEDKNGTIYFVTSRGVCKLVNDKIIFYKHNFEGILSAKSIKDKDDNIWLITLTTDLKMTHNKNKLSCCILVNKTIIGRLFFNAVGMPIVHAYGIKNVQFYILTF